MLRLAGMFPDLFMCSVCMRQIEAGEDRHLAVGLQAVICSSCDHRDGVGIHPEVPVVLNWVLRNRLEGEMVKGILGSLGKGDAGSSRTESVLDPILSGTLKYTN
jgi:hypothetical protein